jgi:hypothetical protein
MSAFLEQGQEAPTYKTQGNRPDEVIEWRKATMQEWDNASQREILALKNGIVFVVRA